MTGLWKASALALLCASALAQAQATYPTKSVTIVVPGGAGSAGDLAARAIGQKLSAKWGQSIVVENVTGAGGNIGTARVAKAAPDGYTLLLNTMAPIAVNPLISSKMPYDSIKDLAPVVHLFSTPNLVAVHPSVPATNIQEFIKLAKAHPGKYGFPSGGQGTSSHLAGVLLNSQAGLDLTHIPYKSTGQMVVDAIGGQVPIIFHNAPAMIPHVQAGQLRGIAITSRTRQPYAPDLPTMIESGVADFEVYAWFGLMAPAKVPGAILDQLNADFNEALTDPDIKATLAKQGADIAGGTREQYAKFIQAEMKKWGKVVKEQGIKDE
jgi:tripartite-type tricarboxylate transporter receptor subunit TctC